MRLSQDTTCTCWYCHRPVCAVIPDPHDRSSLLGVCWKHAAQTETDRVNARYQTTH